MNLKARTRFEAVSTRNKKSRLKVKVKNEIYEVPSFLVLVQDFSFSLMPNSRFRPKSINHTQIWKYHSVTFPNSGMIDQLRTKTRIWCRRKRKILHKNEKTWHLVNFIFDYHFQSGLPISCTYHCNSCSCCSIHSFVVQIYVFVPEFRCLHLKKVIYKDKIP